jgi:hypothetical protein
MLVFSFIAGLVAGASLGIILFSLLIAGKKNDAIYYICPECKIKHAVGDVEVNTIHEVIVQR